MVVRQCGRSPATNSLLLLLQSICQQISYNFNLSLESVPSDLAPTVIYLLDIMKNASTEHPIFVFLDSIDEVKERVRVLCLYHLLCQIATDPDRDLLSWIPLSLPPHCKMLVSCTRDEELQSESHDYTHHYNVLSARVDNPLLVIHLGHLGPQLGLTARPHLTPD